MSPGHYPEAAICQFVLQGLATQSSGPFVTGRIYAAFSSYSDLLLHLPPVTKRPSWSGPEGREKTHIGDPKKRKKKERSKFWTICHNVNWDKLMMQPQFLPGLASLPTAWLLTLGAGGMHRYAAKINSSLPHRLTDFTCFTRFTWFYLESAWYDYSIS